MRKWLRQNVPTVLATLAISVPLVLWVVERSEKPSPPELVYSVLDTPIQLSNGYATTCTITNVGEQPAESFVGIVKTNSYFAQCLTPGRIAEYPGYAFDARSDRADSRPNRYSLRLDQLLPSDHVYFNVLIADAGGDFSVDAQARGIRAVPAPSHLADRARLVIAVGAIFLFLCLTLLIERRRQCARLTDRIHSLLLSGTVLKKEYEFLEERFKALGGEENYRNLQAMRRRIDKQKAKDD